MISTGHFQCVPRCLDTSMLVVGILSLFFSHHSFMLCCFPLKRTLLHVIRKHLEFPAVFGGYERRISVDFLVNCLPRLIPFPIVYALCCEQNQPTKHKIVNYYGRHFVNEKREMRFIQFPISTDT